MNLLSDCIGIFDSGVGGLTAVHAAEKYLPNEHIIYFGDTEHMPYGGRSFDTIEKFASSDFNFLLSFDVKIIIAACGTVSSVVLPHIKNKYPVPIIGVVEPGSAAAVSKTRNGRIGVLATAAAIKSGAYNDAITRKDSSVQVFPMPAPLFVPLVENGRFHKGDRVAKLVAQEYLEPLLKENIDTLVLGCTHYPFLSEIIQSVCGDSVTLVNPAEEAVKTAHDVLKDRGSLSDNCKGNPDFYVSSDIDSFKHIAEIFLGKAYTIRPSLVNIDKY
ncbi:MAG: glutamate racemase [Bacillota bacterium]|nr:glutamate racemase [Bacillota bacterium]